MSKARFNLIPKGDFVSHDKGLESSGIHRVQGQLLIEIRIDIGRRDIGINFPYE